MVIPVAGSRISTSSRSSFDPWQCQVGTGSMGRKPKILNLI